MIQRIKTRMILMMTRVVAEGDQIFREVELEHCCPCFLDCSEAKELSFCLYWLPGLISYWAGAVVVVFKTYRTLFRSFLQVVIIIVRKNSTRLLSMKDWRMTKERILCPKLFHF